MDGRFELASYTLKLGVEPDPLATSAIAESSGYLDPHVSRPGQVDPAR